MNECERACNLLGEFQEQLLDSDNQRFVSDHLHDCALCREDYKWYGYALKALANLEQVTPPEDFMVALRSKLYETPQRSSVLQFFKNLTSFSPYLPLPVGATTLAVLVVLGFLVYNHSPSPVVTTTSAMQSASESPDRHFRAGALSGGSSASILGKGFENAAPSASGPVPHYAMSAPRSMGETARVAARTVPTTADLIGADNLTVESPSVDRAIDSLKRVLPNIHGQLIDEMARGGAGEVVLGIRIPYSAYGHLTSELINHGALAVGAGSQALPPTRSSSDNNNVVLYVRFINSQ